MAFLIGLATLAVVVWLIAEWISFHHQIRRLDESPWFRKRD